MRVLQYHSRSIHKSIFLLSMFLFCTSAYAGAETVSGNVLASSSVVRGGESPKKLTADISGLQELYLVATDAGDGNSYDQAIWAAPKLIRENGEAIDITTQNLNILSVGWGKVENNRNNNGKPLRIAAKEYEKGFWAHAPSVLKVKLNGAFTRIECFVGIDAQAGKNGSAVFEFRRTPPVIALPRVNVKVPFPEVIKTATLEEQMVSLRMAIDDITGTFPDQYDGAAYLQQLKAIESTDNQEEKAAALQQLQREALLGNPALDFDDLLLIRRHLGKNRDRTSMGRGLGFVGGNFYSMQNAPRNMRGNEIAILRDFKAAAQYETLYAPQGNKLISDLDLGFDGKTILFSSVNDSNAFRLFEVVVDGGGLRQVTPDTDGDDVDHFDACYLPDGDIIFTSTATFLGMPCIDGIPRMSSLYRFSPKSGEIRQISFDQDSSWCPTMMNDGRVLYLRWEYTDMVHSNNRVLMTMNPDGTSQKSYLFSNSYFPASFFYARPIPGDPSTVVGIAGGHHGFARSGRMLLVDPRLGEHEADGVVQEIPGYGEKVEPIIRDRLVDGIWPHLVHPFPVAESETHRGAGKYFLVSMKPDPSALWGIYLVDIFDNSTLIVEMEEYAFFEPIPLKMQKRPQVKPSMIRMSESTATVFIQDIYTGPGLKGIPKGTVKSLRIGSYEFSPSYSSPTTANVGSGGLLGTIGLDGPWDIRSILGTVPVYEDGSAHFTIPASVPVYVQPLDEDGQALQLMRSWFVGQPGERVSCIGCHESARETPSPRRTLASAAEPSVIRPWSGAMRNFDYVAEIQPIVDRNCMACHDGEPVNGRYESLRAEYQAQPIPDLGPELIDDWAFRYSGQLSKQKGGGRFSKGYIELFRLARGPGIESDMHILTPKEFSADSTELVQMLKKGHHGVKLEEQEWRKLYEWIDLNTPYYGNRLDIVRGLPNEEGVVKAMCRSNELALEHSGSVGHFDTEVPTADAVTASPVPPNAEPERKLRSSGTIPFKAIVQEKTKQPLTFDLGNEQTIKLVYVPAGQFVMGSSSGALDELPMHPQRIEKGFWMAEAEINNAQMRCFDPLHDSRHEDRVGYQFGQPCYDVNGDELPAVRLSWSRAMEFCAWLSDKTGRNVTLPTESQWEWACRAGTGTPFWFGELDGDFSQKANLADKRTEEFAEDTARGAYQYFDIEKLKNPSRYEAYIPRIGTIDDHAFLQQSAKKYDPNPWGLYDMHGNVAEWTRSAYQSYPITDTKDENDKRVVRGGSWRDRPYRGTASYRLSYPEFQQVFNVGFRVIVEE